MKPALQACKVEIPQVVGPLLSYSLHSFKGCYIGDYIGECYKA